MPTYDYKCTVCSHFFEMFQPMSAEPIKQCPECNGDVKRLIGTGLKPIFKGSGFYQTDYKSSQNSKTVSNTGTAKTDSSKVIKKDTNTNAA